MAVIIVGGQTKNVGKTTLICNIIAAFPKLKWTAVKISSHPHVPEHCAMIREGAAWTIWEQNAATDRNDTARFLRSGARRALLVEAAEKQLKEACASLQQEFEPAGAVIVESAAAAECLHYDLFLMLLDSAQSDFKESAKQQRDRASAFVVTNPAPEGEGVFGGLKARPVFTAFSDHLDAALTSMLVTKLASGI